MIALALFVGALGFVLGVTAAIAFQRPRVRQLERDVDNLTGREAFEACVPRVRVLLDHLQLEGGCPRQVLGFDVNHDTLDRRVLLERVPSFHLRPGESLMISLQQEPLSSTLLGFVHAGNLHDAPRDLLTWWERDTRPTGAGL